VRLVGKAPTVTNVNAVTFGVLAEGWRVQRPLIAKIKQSSSITATLTGKHKVYNTKVPFTFAGGATQRPAFLDVNHGIPASHAAISDNAKASYLRTAGLSTKAFTSSSATAFLSGGHTYIEAVAATSSSVLVYLSGVTPISGKAATSTALIIVEFNYLTPHFYLHCPVEYDIPAVLPTDRTTAKRLFRYYRNRPSGVNVFIYSTGEITTIEPDGYTRIWREADRTSDTDINAAIVVRVFWGGHEAERVTPAEATALTASGFDVRTHA
jgi:hypothetical protein